jgi:hypothetical protein
MQPLVDRLSDSELTDRFARWLDVYERLAPPPDTEV